VYQKLSDNLKADNYDIDFGSIMSKLIDNRYIINETVAIAEIKYPATICYIDPQGVRKKELKCERPFDFKGVVCAVLEPQLVELAEMKKKCRNSEHTEEVTTWLQCIEDHIHDLHHIYDVLGMGHPPQ
jgi:hypothetical protein